MKLLKIIQSTTRTAVLAGAVLALSGVVYAADNTPKPDLTKVEESRTAIRDGIKGVRNYVGIGGTFNMSPDGHSGLGNKGSAMLQIKDGQFVLVQ